jgi:branched-chain amino acid aminotransferase
LAKEQGFDQVIWTDSNEHSYLEEAGTMNVFFRINDTLITAPTTDTILDGVTRKSIIQIAKDNGIDVQVKKLKVEELKNAARNGSLKEIFGAGTAAVVSQINAFQHKEELFELEDQNDSYAEKLKSNLVGIQTNQLTDHHNWRSKI